MSDTASLTLGLALLAGLASFLSACVLPLVPSCVTQVAGATLGALATGDRAHARRRAALHAALLVLGFAAVFVALGATTTVVGSALRRALPLLQRVGGGAIAAFGILLVLARPGRHASAPAAGVASAVAGVALGAAWTPCIGPVLATILLLAGAGETTGRGTSLLVAYAFGLALAMFATTFALNWLLAGSRAVAARARPLQRAAGMLLVVVGALLATGRFTALSSFLAGFGQLVTPGS